MTRESKPTEWIPLTIHVHAISAKALLLSETGDENKACWVPKSQIRPETAPERDKTLNLEMADWIAEREGFV